jgi:hypothetical protein
MQAVTGSPAYVSIRQYTSAYVSIRKAYDCKRQAVTGSPMIFGGWFFMTCSRYNKFGNHCTHTHTTRARARARTHILDNLLPENSRKRDSSTRRGAYCNPEAEVLLQYYGSRQTFALSRTLGTNFKNMNWVGVRGVVRTALSSYSWDIFQSLSVLIHSEIGICLNCLSVTRDSRENDACTKYTYVGKCCDLLDAQEHSREVTQYSQAYYYLLKLFFFICLHVHHIVFFWHFLFACIKL